MHGPEVKASPKPKLLDGTSCLTGVVILGGEAIGVIGYGVANPYPKEARVSSPNILVKGNKSPEAISHQSALAKADMPKAIPLGETEASVAMAGILALGLLAGNGIRRLRRHRLMRKA